jgi:hypothetical protein
LAGADWEISFANALFARNEQQWLFCLALVKVDSLARTRMLSVGTIAKESVATDTLEPKNNIADFLLMSESR